MPMDKIIDIKKLNFSTKKVISNFNKKKYQINIMAGTMITDIRP